MYSDTIANPWIIRVVLYPWMEISMDGLVIVDIQGSSVDNPCWSIQVALGCQGSYVDTLPPLAEYPWMVKYHVIALTLLS